MTDQILDLAWRLGHWTYALIFVMATLEASAFLGLVVPGETMTIAAGFMASAGVLELTPTIVAAALGAMLGDSIGYEMGRRLGRPWLARHGERFLSRIYTEAERARAERRANRIDTYAKRFAAKEACAKALGTGFRQGVFFRDMGVVNLPSGKPTMVLTGGALRRLAALTPPGYEAQIDLALTDEYPLAQAFVVISAMRQAPS